MKHTRAPFALVLLLTGVGCQQHFYKITDVQTGKEFYTRTWLPGAYGRYGSIHFRELATGDHVVLQSSRAAKVTEQEALRATGK